MTDLETRIRQLEDLEAIRRLKHYYYCHCVDRTVAGDAQAAAETISRFADDIVADFTGLPLLDGKDAVSEFYAEGVPGFISWCQHRVMNEVINIDGDVATADWYVDCPAVFRDGNPSGIVGSGFIAGRYQEVYARVNGIWMWQRITALLDVQAAADDHWDHAGFVRVNR